MPARDWDPGLGFPAGSRVPGRELWPNLHRAGGDGDVLSSLTSATPCKPHCQGPSHPRSYPSAAHSTHPWGSSLQRAQPVLHLEQLPHSRGQVPMLQPHLLLQLGFHLVLPVTDALGQHRLAGILLGVGNEQLLGTERWGIREKEEGGRFQRPPRLCLTPSSPLAQGNIDTKTWAGVTCASFARRGCSPHLRQRWQGRCPPAAMGVVVLTSQC